MTVNEDFDYEHLILDLCSQAKEVIPKDLSESDKKYVLDVIYNYMNTALGGLKDDGTTHYSDENGRFIIQFVGEWIFHKSIDLRRANFKNEHTDEILQHIAFVVYGISKTALLKGMSDNYVAQVLEHHVEKGYKEKLEELYNNGDINTTDYENALAQSNIDSMSDNKILEENTENEVYEKENNTSNFLENYILIHILNHIVSIFTIAIIMTLLFVTLHMVNKFPKIIEIYKHNSGNIIPILLITIFIVFIFRKQAKENLSTFINNIKSKFENNDNIFVMSIRIILSSILRTTLAIIIILFIFYIVCKFPKLFEFYKPPLSIIIIILPIIIIIFKEQIKKLFFTFINKIKNEEHKP